MEKIRLILSICVFVFVLFVCISLTRDTISDSRQKRKSIIFKTHFITIKSGKVDPDITKAIKMLFEASGFVVLLQSSPVSNIRVEKIEKILVNLKVSTEIGVHNVKLKKCRHGWYIFSVSPRLRRAEEMTKFFSAFLFQ